MLRAQEKPLKNKVLGDEHWVWHELCIPYMRRTLINHNWSRAVMMRTISASIVGLALALSPLALMADPFKIDLGGGNVTADINSLGNQNTGETSLFFATADANITDILVTNNDAVLSSWGQSTYGLDQRVMIPSPGLGLISGFGYSDLPADWGSTITIGGTDFTSWGLTADFTFEGTVIGDITNPTDVFFTGGTLAFDYQTSSDGAGAVRVLEAELIGGGAGLGNIVLSSEVFYAAGVSSFVENFFINSATGKTFFELVQEEFRLVLARTDTNRDIGTLEFTGDTGVGELIAVGANELNNSTRFDVVEIPEPGLLGLFGLGLLALGFVARRRPNRLMA